MKKKLLYLLLVVLVVSVAFSACNKENGGNDNNGNENNQITMIVASLQIEFIIMGTGNICINWGDGTTPEIFTGKSAPK